MTGWTVIDTFTSLFSANSAFSIKTLWCHDVMEVQPKNLRTWLKVVWHFWHCSTAATVCDSAWHVRLPDVLEPLEFAIKTGYVLNLWKTFCCPWVFSGVLKQLRNFSLLITLNNQESRLNNVFEQNNVQIYFILNGCVVKSELFKNSCAFIISIV